MNNEVAAIAKKTGLSTEKVEEILRAIEGVDFFDLSEESSDKIDSLNQEGVLDWDWIPFSCGEECCGFQYVEKKIKGPKGMVRGDIVFE